MKRTRSTLCFALPLVVTLGIAIALTTAPAYADNDWKYSWGYMSFNDGSQATAYYNSKTNQTVIFYTYEDGSAFWSQVISGNYKPAGEESGTDDAVGKGSRTEPVDVAGLIAKGLITIVNVKANPENTPLAKWIDSEGGGMIPHYNPYDDDKGPGRTPKGSTGGLTAAQLAEIARLANYTAKALEGIGTSMGDGFDGLSSESLPTGNKSGSSGRKKGTSDGSGSKDNRKSDNKGAEDLGPRPDLVNPQIRSGGAGKSGVIAPGLLEGGSSFSTNRPSGTGTPLGIGTPASSGRGPSGANTR